MTWAASTRTHREASIRNWIRPQLGGVRLRDLGRQRVVEWRAGIIRDGAKPRTVNFAVQTLSAALTAAVEAGRLPANPCLGLRRVPQPPLTRRALTPDEVERIRADMPSIRDRVLVSLMAYAGLRPGEALALHWTNVTVYEHHLGAFGELLVSESYGYGELRDTKTGQARTVRVGGSLADDLIEYIGSGARHGCVIQNRSGGYLDLRTCGAASGGQRSRGPASRVSRRTSCATPTRRCSSTRGEPRRRRPGAGELARRRVEALRARVRAAFRWTQNRHNGRKWPPPTSRRRG